MLEVRPHAVDGGVVHVLTMQRPPVNAMDTSMLRALIDALAAADEDQQAVGVVLAGGDQVFSAGADLRESTPDYGAARMELFTVFYDRLTNHRLPTVAAVEGIAVGGGAEAVAACDHRVLGRDASLRFPGASLGIPVGTARLVGQVPLGVAKDWLLSGRDVTAEEAHERGLAQTLAMPGSALGDALDWLGVVAMHDRTTVERLKAMANDAAGVAERVVVENRALRVAAGTRDTAYGRSGR